MDRIKYLIWNNKGGVGKTFLTYMLSVEYAIKHPSEEVVVVDACPQANVSEMILGGNGKGEANLEALRGNNITIAGYIKDRYERSKSAKLGTETNYFVKADDYNKNMPPNLYLLPGDVDLDICSTIINYMGTAPEKSAWKKSRLLLSDLISSFEQRKQSIDKKQVYFIDCNPSFANYTEMAVVASSRIIVPCTADAASIRGIRNLFKLIYGIDLGSEKLEDEVFLVFHSNATAAGLSLPDIHRFVQNKSRSNLADAATAFKSHVAEIKNVVASVKAAHPEVFSSNGGGDVLNVKDGNTLAAIINHVGLPLSKLPAKKYQIYGKSTQASDSQIGPLVKDLDAVLATL
ncbi:ParA family protein [Azospirillum sp. BE72]|uniref:ParA family protein n=1 Tax=Azospirillum sp. BE72 TaxID=2817776 RepID=UPI00285EE674|nr:ParA family protein [Azospirillum sp. BE72]MDR6773578.1 cellulose biosynthesis protein BcsQ [Azospirillum sp. BE72]